MKDFVQRIIFNNQTIYSKDYPRMKKRNSYTVKFISSEGSIQFGFIQSFVRVKKFFLAIVQPFEVVSRSWSLSNKHNLPRRLSKYSLHDLAVHMHRIDMTVMLPFIAILIKNILSKCVFIQISDDPNYAHISEFPNMNDGDSETNSGADNSF